MDREKDKNRKPVADKQEKSRKEQAKDYMTMSQWQNRFGNGRERNGSDGSGERANRLNH